MTLDPNMFTQQAISGKAVLPADAANGFFGPVCSILGATSATAVAGPTTLTASSLVHFDLAFPTGVATATFTVTTPDKIEIVDVIVRKSAAGAGNTVQVKDGSANAISDAIVATTDKAITRAGTIDPAFNTIAAGGTFTVVNTFAAGSIAANVTVVCRRV